MLAASDRAGQAGEVHLGLQFRLDPGWKIYWRSPGDAGFPPSLDWQGSENLAEAAIQWPVPHRFTLFGLQTFGYGGEVVLPILVTARTAGRGARGYAPSSTTWSARRSACRTTPSSTWRFPPARRPRPRRDCLIAEARALVPGGGAEAGLALEGAFLGGDQGAAGASGGRPLRPALRGARRPGRRAARVFSSGSQRWRSWRTAGWTELTLTTGRGPLAEGVLEGKRLTLTVIDGAARAGERGGRAPPRRRTAAAGPAGWAALFPMLGLALLGGLILNLMPLRPARAVDQVAVGGRAMAGATAPRCRVGFLASAAGILASFLVLAAIALAAQGGRHGGGVGDPVPAAAVPEHHGPRLSCCSRSISWGCSRFRCRVGSAGWPAWAGPRDPADWPGTS